MGQSESDRRKWMAEGEMREEWRLSTSWGNTAAGMSELFVAKNQLWGQWKCLCRKVLKSTQEIRRLLFTDRKHTSSYTDITQARQKDKFFLTPVGRTRCECAVLLPQGLDVTMAELAVEIFTHYSALIEEPDTITMSASTVFFALWYDFWVLLRITAACWLNTLYKSIWIYEMLLIWFVFFVKLSWRKCFSLQSIARLADY